MKVREVLLNDIVTIRVLRHCAQECEYQRSGEMSVLWMVTAWNWATEAFEEADRPDLDAIFHIGGLVEPHKNQYGFRKVGVRVGWDVKMDWRKVPAAMESLVEHGADLTPAEFFKEFEEIHPFVDGNGRTGNILYNWLNGTMADPLMPPDFWGQDRIVGRMP